MDKKFYIKNLQDILTMAETGKFSLTFELSAGICRNLINLYKGHGELPCVSEKMSDSFLSWEGFSGEVLYPIASDSIEESAAEYYLMYDDLWLYRQLEQRISLLKHLIAVA